MVGLVKFWTGWEVVDERQLTVEVKCGQLPTSMTCVRTLRLPGHFDTYEKFQKALEASITSEEFGFGLH